MTTGDKCRLPVFILFTPILSLVLPNNIVFLWLKCELDAAFVFIVFTIYTIFLEFARESFSGLPKISGRTQS